MPAPLPSRRVSKLCLRAMLAAMALVALLWAGLIPPLSDLAWRLDARLRDRLSLMLPPTPQRDDLVFVGFDEQSSLQSDISPALRSTSRALTLLHTDADNQHLDRRVCIDLVERLAAAGARQIIFDVLFVGTSGDPAVDREFATVLKKYGDRIILSELLNPQDDGSYTPVSSLAELPGLAEAPGTAPQLGYVNIWPDAEDGILRHMIYETTLAELTHTPLRPDEPLHRSLAAVAGKTLGVDLPTHPFPRLRFATAESTDQSTLAQSVSTAYAPHSLHHLFVPQLWQDRYQNGAFFRGKTVLISTATPRDEDLHLVPGDIVFGAQYHLQALGCLLEDSFWKEAPRWVDLTALLLMAAVGILLTYAFHHPFAQALSCLALAGGFFVACLLLSKSTGLLFAGTPGLLGLLSVSLLGLTIKLFTPSQT